MARVSQSRKLAWFGLGARSFATLGIGDSVDPIYPCPICLTNFTVDAVADGRLTAEDVPLRSLGGRPLLLTCKNCNNEAGASIDADAKGSENVRKVLAGKRTESVRATVGDVKINADVDLATGQLKVDYSRNPPGTREKLQAIRAGDLGTYVIRQPSELGKNISWLKAGYLTLVAEYGFKIAFDPAMAIVRKQIIEYEERKMVTFLTELNFEVDVNVRRICRVLTPTDQNGWAVQVGRFFMFYPIKGDMNFYERLARYAGTNPNTTAKVMRVPTSARFGFDDVASETNEGSSGEQTMDAAETSAKTSL